MSRSGPVGGRQFESLREGLSERDLAVITSVADLRYLTARQIETLHFVDHATPLSGARTCRRVLERLTEQRMLARLERRVGGVRAGSASFVYRIGPVGDRLVREGKPRRRSQEPSFIYLDHTLEVSQLVIDLTAASRNGGCEVVNLEVEPACWRTVRAGLGGSETLKPDLFVALGVGEFEYRWFIEVDRGTEHLPAVLRKCRLYNTYYRTGHEEHARGVFPKVIWAVPDTKRVEHFTHAIEHDRRLETKLFSVVTAEQLVGVLTGGGL